MILAITAVGANQTDVIPELLQIISDSLCTVAESRLTVFANQFTGYWCVDGNWNHIAKLENFLSTAANRRGFKIATSRVDESDIENSDDQSILPYTIDVVSADRIGIVNELASFLAERNILIQDLTTSAYSASYTGTAVFSAHIIVGIPADVRLISLRDEFLDFCDREHLDAILEPLKR